MSFKPVSTSVSVFACLWLLLLSSFWLLLNIALF